MDREKPKVLAVDDKPENLYTLEMLLKKLDVEVMKAASGFEALRLVLEHDFCVAIVDIQMPELDGYELVELLRSNADTANLPVIFVSAIYSDDYHHRKGYEAGAVDFMSKPFIPEILLSKVQVFIDLYQHRKALEAEVEQRRAAEQALQKANMELARLNGDKDRFFSIISHDLRSPFNALIGNTQLLATSIERFDKDEIQEMAESIHGQARAAYSLLDSLLTWARLQRESGMKCNPQQIELKELVQDMMTVLEKVAEQKEIAVSNGIAAGVQVMSDRNMLETVIRNLISNAIKFTPRGGKITISDEESKQPGYITVTVTDTGIGMSPVEKARLFRIETHYSTAGTEQEKGNGLGLIICKEMVERNEGTIWVESEPGKGTKMSFTIPISAEGEALVQAE